MATVPATVRWGKERFTLQLTPGSPSDKLMQQIFALTRVPVERQKLMCAGAWRGALRSGSLLDASLALRPGQSELAIMLMGTAEAAPTAPSEPTVFAEDLSEEDIAAAAAAATAEAVAKAEGMIAALQLEPGLEREESHAMLSNLPVKYNYFVHGLPQQAIEGMLRRRRKCCTLLDVCAMTLGHEVGKAYVNAVACLADGTLASGLDNGHLQLWRHGRRLSELVHEPLLGMLGQPLEAIRCLVALPASEEGPVVASGAEGSVKLWTHSTCVATIPTPPGVAPIALAVPPGWSALAVAVRQARPFDPNAFRLVPQNEEQRQRRAEALAAQQVQRELFNQAARTVAVVGLAAGGAGSWQHLEPHGAAVTALASISMHPPGESGVQQPGAGELRSMHRPEEASLVSGDAEGSLRLWRRDTAVVGAVGRAEATWREAAQLQLVSAATLSVIGVESLTGPPAVLATSLAAATATTDDRAPPHHAAAADGAALLRIPAPASLGYVALVDVARQAVLATLDAHADFVGCMCALPDGSLATAGGKHDGTVRVWARSQWLDEAGGAPGGGGGGGGGDGGGITPPLVLREATQTLSEPGYIFGMAALPDAKPSSPLFALACARYNTVKICL